MNRQSGELGRQSFRGFVIRKRRSPLLSEIVAGLSLIQDLI
jgi:hypothetical protein